MQELMLGWLICIDLNTNIVVSGSAIIKLF